MTPIEKSHNNTVILDSYNERFFATYSDGKFYTYWSPSFLDILKMLFLGQHIRVCITSKFQPPIMVDTYD